MGRDRQVRDAPICELLSGVTAPVCAHREPADRGEMTPRWAVSPLSGGLWGSREVHR